MPTRTCIGCRASCAQDRLLRFRRRRDGVVVSATTGRRLAHGRSAYLCPRRACFQQAQKRRAFGRAFARSGRVDPKLDIDALIQSAADELDCELTLLSRCAPDRAIHPRQRGLEALLFELSSQPATPERRSGPANTEAAVSTEHNDPRRNGGASHG